MKFNFKKIFPLFLSLMVIAAFAPRASAQKMNDQAPERGHKKARVSPNATISQTIGTQKFKVTYGRPSVKGRNVFGGLQKYGKVWRTGANESTDIVIPTDVKVEGQSLKAGVYSIYTIPRKDQWTVIFNSKLSWGTKYDKSKDVLRVQVNAQQAPKMEQELIYFRNVTDQSADMVIWWNTTRVPVMIKL